MRNMYYMQFSYQVLEVMRLAMPPTLDLEEYEQFLISVRRLAEEELTRIRKQYKEGETDEI